jgi:polyphosphate kinase
VTRNSNLYVDEDEAENLLRAIEGELQNRRKGQAVRLEVEQGVRPTVLATLREQCGLGDQDVYLVDGPVNMQRLLGVYEDIARPDLKEPAYNPVVPIRLKGESLDLFAAIRQGDLLLHHPYESFGPVMDFLSKAADDPQVLAIKQTFYRTSGDSPMVEALIRAARNGKQVTVLMELKARFDEENNIQLAKVLEEAGIHVVYGLVGLKTHGKLLLVVRQEGEALVRYVHLGTGNYNPRTAKIYTDLGFLTCRPEIGRDVAAVFNALTASPADSKIPAMERLLVAPSDLAPEVLKKVRRESANARRGKPARLIAKMNSLADPAIIMALYEASKAGVKIELCVRGICLLRPGLPGLSENVRVTSIVDRYLEHSRIFYFENGGEPEVWLGSADWMPRNFERRLEVLFPLEDPALKARVIQVLTVYLSDNVKARRLQSDGSYQAVRPKAGTPAFRSQQVLSVQAQEQAAS